MSTREAPITMKEISNKGSNQKLPSLGPRRIPDLTWRRAVQCRSRKVRTHVLDLGSSKKVSMKKEKKNWGRRGEFIVERLQTRLRCVCIVWTSSPTGLSRQIYKASIACLPSAHTSGIFDWIYFSRPDVDDIPSPTTPHRSIPLGQDQERQR